MGLDHVGRRLHELDQDSFTADRRIVAPLGVDEADVEAGRTLPNATGREPNSLTTEPLDCGSEVVDPESDVVQRGVIHARPTVGIDRLHEVHLDRERSCAGGGDVLVDVLALAPEGPAWRETEEVDPEAAERPLVART